MIEFIRDPKTGYVYSYKNGKLLGAITDMGDIPPEQPSQDLWKLKHGKKKND